MSLAARSPKPEKTIFTTESTEMNRSRLLWRALCPQGRQWHPRLEDAAGSGSSPAGWPHSGFRPKPRPHWCRVIQFTRWREGFGCWLLLRAVSWVRSGIYTSLGLGSPCKHGSYEVLGLFNSAELNDLEGVSILLTPPNYIGFALPVKRSL